MISAFQWVLILFGIISGSIGGILVKLGTRELSYDQQFAGIVWSVATNYKILIALFMYFMPFVIWLFLLKRMDLSRLQPLFSLVYVLTPLLAIAILGEKISVNRWLGIAL